MARWISRCFLTLLLAVSWSLSARSQSGNITYIYDELGRLVGVVQPNGESATYAYDAAGNLESIARRGPGTVVIIHFSPRSGPVGTTVTISGSGFSATPNENVVRFGGSGGTVATVTSATTTQLITTVPAGAMPGPGRIAVMAPLGSAESTTDFTVTAATPAPTITGFIPTIGVPARGGMPATGVTISGTNFQTNVAQNRVTFNLTYGTVSSATATTIGTSVPAQVGSGRISVMTPFGRAVSNGDFFVPPVAHYPPSPPILYTPDDVDSRARMGVGSSGGVASITTPSKIALLIFDGTAGQQLTAHATAPPSPPTIPKVTSASTRRMGHDWGR